MNKEGSFKPIAVALIISMMIAFFWDKISFLKNIVHAVLDPTAGALINWNLTIGMIIIILVLTYATTLIQKYTTDQQTLKELKKQQKEISKKSKEFRHDPQKMLEIQKELGPITMKTLKLSMRAFVYTSIPLILLFRWFMDIFATMGSPKFFGFMGWLVFYLVFSIIFSSILRKVMDVA